MLLGRRISTQAWINDFQDNISASTIIQNAVAAGIPADDVEVVDLPQAEYETVKESILAPLRIAAEQEAELTRQQLLTIMDAARTKWGFTRPQMKLLVQALRQVAEGDLD